MHWRQVPRLFCGFIFLLASTEIASSEYFDRYALSKPGLVLTPKRITTPPWQAFRFFCTSLSDSQPTVVFASTQKPIEQDPRYNVRLVNSTTVEVTTPEGLRSPQDSTIIECSIPLGERESVTITVEDSCGRDRLPCRDKICKSVDFFCDGKVDCVDGSDELPRFCPELPEQPLNVRFSPSEQRVRPGQMIRLECNALRPNAHTRPIIEFGDGTPIEVDSQFRIDYPTPGRMVIVLPGGSSVNWRQKNFQCYLPGGSKQRAVVFIDKNCEIGQRRCDNGQCLHMGQFCDGKPDCSDHSDEMQKNCDVCDPISKKCETVSGVAPKIPFFQEHWRCDGENDCGNGYDELNCRNFSRVPGSSCGGPQFTCSRQMNLDIPIAYECDGQIDCPNGEDEAGCMNPMIVKENWEVRKAARRGEVVVLECEVAGVPPPVIIWRFNWGCLPETADRGYGRFHVEFIEGSQGCRGSRSRLTIHDFREGDDGIYNCEGLSGLSRALSEDMFVILVD